MGRFRQRFFADDDLTSKEFGFDSVNQKSLADLDAAGFGVVDWLGVGVLPTVSCTNAAYNRSGIGFKQGIGLMWRDTSLLGSPSAWVFCERQNNNYVSGQCVERRDCSSFLIEYTLISDDLNTAGPAYFVFRNALDWSSYLYQLGLTSSNGLLDTETRINGGADIHVWGDEQERRHNKILMTARRVNDNSKQFDISVWDSAADARADYTVFHNAAGAGNLVPLFAGPSGWGSILGIIVHSLRISATPLSYGEAPLAI